MFLHPQARAQRGRWAPRARPLPCLGLSPHRAVAFSPPVPAAASWAPAWGPDPGPSLPAPRVRRLLSTRWPVLVLRPAWVAASRAENTD